jgi:hypothetical protein
MTGHKVAQFVGPCHSIELTHVRALPYRHSRYRGFINRGRLAKASHAELGQFREAFPI